MFKLVCFICLCVALSIGIPVFSASPLSFKKYGVQDGLSHSTVYSLTQDKKGTMWIGTINGLNSFDGTSFTSFYHNVNDSVSLADNCINSLYTDTEGTIWIGTSVGLSCYDWVNGDFKNYKPYVGGFVAIYEIEEIPETSNLLLSTSRGLTLFDKRNATFEFISEFYDKVIYCSCKITENEYWIGSSDGLWKFFLNSKKAQIIDSVWHNRQVVDIVYDKKRSSIWVATQEFGLFRINMDYQIDKHYTQSKLQYDLSSNMLKVLYLDNNSDELWIGTMDGLFVMDIPAERFYVNKQSSDNIYSIGHNSVRAIYKDSYGGMWIGTYYGGLNYSHPSLSVFYSMQSKGANAVSSLSDNVISCVTEDPYTGGLWIGTNDGGLNCYDRKTKTFTYYKAGYSNRTLRSNNIKACIVDKNRDVYVGTHGGGLGKISGKDGTVENFRLPGMQGVMNSCYALCEFEEGKLWVGTMNGLYVFDKKAKKFTLHPLSLNYPSFFNNSLVSYVFEDSQKQVWIATDKNLLVYTDGRMEEKKFLLGSGEWTSILANWVFEDSSHVVWIATNIGLFQRSGEKMKYYSVADGLLSNCVYSIAEDARKRIWLTTDKGLSCLDTKTMSFQNYTERDGLANGQFNHRSACSTSDGLLCFGSLDGLIYFDPLKISKTGQHIKADITGVGVMNLPITRVAQENVIYQRASDGTPLKLSFPSDMKFFHVEFGAVDYLSSKPLKFAYRLKGFNDEWILEQTGLNKASFSNLSPGTYLFQVKACNDLEEWSENMAELQVVILPMWYQSWWFRCVFIMGILLIVGGIIYLYLNKMRYKLAVQLEHQQRLQSEALGQEKIKFYINVSHELRTPLSLIMAPLEELIHDSGKWDANARSKLQMMYRNCRYLLNVINQLLFSRKVEKGAQKLNIASYQLDELVGNVLDLFEEQAQKKHIDLSFENGMAGLMVPADKIFIELILVNLLANAFKFTPDGKSISVSIQTDNDQFRIKVRDTGVGMPMDKMEHIFERFYQIDSNHKGTGVGLSLVKDLVDKHHGTISVDSRVNEYSEFIVTLPLKMEIYNAEELLPLGEYRQDSKGASEYMTFDEEEEMYRTNEICERKYTILVVDDEMEMLDYLGKSLGKIYNVILAHNGQEAWEILESEREGSIDVILSDRMMPIMTGDELCKNVKQCFRTKHIPFILLSAKGDWDKQIEGINLGADDYMVKPFSIFVLKGKIANWLSYRRNVLTHYSQSLEIDKANQIANSLDNLFMEKVVGIVEANLENNSFSVDDLANIMCIGRSTLYAKMSSISGEAPANFIRRIRFARACTLLVEGRLSITEVGMRLGFSSSSYFASSFKRYVGCTPSEYIKENRTSSK